MCAVANETVVAKEPLAAEGPTSTPDSPTGPLDGLPRGRLRTARMPGVNKEASRLIYGTLFLHSLPSEEEVYALLDSVWATGCNAFDCAAIYGGGICEERMGRWLRSRHLCSGKAREEMVLITKGGCEGQDKLWAATIADHARVRSELERSLRRLGVAYVDLYLLHRDDPTEPIERIVSFMSSLVDAGLIHAWGVSNWQLPRLAAALEHARRAGLHPPSADSPQNSLAEPSRAVWPNTCFMAAERRPQWQKATRGQVAMMGWECLAKGFMCGKWSRQDGEVRRAAAPPQEPPLPSHRGFVPGAASPAPPMRRPGRREGRAAARSAPEAALLRCGLTSTSDPDPRPPLALAPRPSPTLRTALALLRDAIATCPRCRSRAACAPALANLPHRRSPRPLACPLGPLDDRT